MHATTPQQVHALFGERFNAGDLDGVLELYEPDAVLVPGPGVVVSGEGIREALAGFLATGLPIDLSERAVFVNGDLALLLSEWAIAGTGADGEPVDIRGTTSDVVRRGPDGAWRLAIDNPFGTA
ncbi:MAG: SgcJ/EcaC family oxidoreductase [Thermoleophilia bacterium]